MATKPERKPAGAWGIVAMVAVVLGISIEKIKPKNSLVYGGSSGKTLKTPLS